MRLNGLKGNRHRHAPFFANKVAFNRKPVVNLPSRGICWLWSVDALVYVELHLCVRACVRGASACVCVCMLSDVTAS